MKLKERSPAPKRGRGGPRVQRGEGSSDIECTDDGAEQRGTNLIKPFVYLGLRDRTSCPLPLDLRLRSGTSTRARALSLLHSSCVRGWREGAGRHLHFCKLEEDKGNQLPFEDRDALEAVKHMIQEEYAEGGGKQGREYIECKI